MPSKRMTKEERRKQLLRLALEIVREEGTEALTLARLAERAGVTKPIAYEHFGTRAGLLLALFRDYDDRTTEAVHAALRTGGKTLAGVSEILSTAYVDSCLAMGPEIGAVFAALSASEEMAEARESWRAFLIEEYCQAFAPFTSLSGREGEALLTGVLGAAQTLAEAAAAGRLSREEAIDALSRITIGALVDRADRATVKSRHSSAA